MAKMKTFIVVICPFWIIFNDVMIPDIDVAHESGLQACLV